MKTLILSIVALLLLASVSEAACGSRGRSRGLFGIRARREARAASYGSGACAGGACSPKAPAVQVP